jgi:hypothetical protein
MKSGRGSSSFRSIGFILKRSRKHYKIPNNNDTKHNERHNPSTPQQKQQIGGKKCPNSEDVVWSVKKILKSMRCFYLKRYSRTLPQTTCLAVYQHKAPFSFSSQEKLFFFFFFSLFFSFFSTSFCVFFSLHFSFNDVTECLFEHL